MFRFKQPSSGSLPFVLCYSYNSQLKYIFRDGSAVWLHIPSSPCFVCVSCIVQNVTFCISWINKILDSIKKMLRTTVKNNKKPFWHVLEWNKLCVEHVTFH